MSYCCREDVFATEKEVRRFYNSVVRPQYGDYNILRDYLTENSSIIEVFYANKRKQKKMWREANEWHYQEWFKANVEILND